MSEKLTALLSSFEIFGDADMKAALDKIILREEKKRLCKMDMDLIAECVDLILEIDGTDTADLAKKENELAEKFIYQVKSEKCEHKPINRRRLPRRVLISAFIIAVMLAVMAMVAGAMGYSVVDLGKKILGIPVNTPMEYNGNDVIRTDDVRSYSSIDELLGSEQLQILFPEKLPDGYEFGSFTVRDTGNEVTVYMKNSNQSKYIEFTVMIDESPTIDEYSYEENGIGYNIFDNEDGTYLACWVKNDNYYWVVVNDKGVIPEIIRYLEECVSYEN